MDQPVRRKVVVVCAGPTGARCADGLGAACDVTMEAALVIHPSKSAA